MYLHVLLILVAILDRDEAVRYTQYISEKGASKSYPLHAWFNLPEWFQRRLKCSQDLWQGEPMTRELKTCILYT